MQIDDHASVRMWAPRARFRLQRRPRFTHTDLPFLNPIIGWGGNTGLEASSELQALFPAPVRVPHNNLLQTGADGGYDAEYAKCTAAGGLDSGLPSQVWTKGSGHTGSWAVLPTWGRDTSRPLGLHVYAPTFAGADSGAIQLEATADCQAFRFTISLRSQPAKSLAAGAGGGTSATPTEPAMMSASVAVGTGGDRRWYTVRWTSGAGIWILRDLEVLHQLPAPRADAAAAAHPGRGAVDPALAIEFRLLCGKLEVEIGAGGPRWAIPEARKVGEVLIETLSAARVEGRKCAALEVVEAGPVFWSRTGRYVSPDIDLGFAAQDDEGLEIRWAGSAPGWTATLDDGASSLVGDRIQFALDLAGPSDGTYKSSAYARKCRPIRAIHLRWAGEVAYEPDAPLAPRPERVIISHAFDPGALQITSSALLQFNSNRPTVLPTGEVGTWAQWGLNYGQVVVEVDLQRTLASGGMSAPTRAFAGYGNTSGQIFAAGGAASYVMGCVDRSVQLMSPRWALPWSDGWNVFYLMRYLAGLGGVTDEDIAFLPSVPASAYEDSVGPDGEPAYFMPLGPVDTMLSRYSGQNLWDVMGQIAVSIGYMRFFDLSGRLVFRKFQIPAGTKRSYYESDPESAQQPGGGIEGCWSIQVARDNGPVRSELIIGGVNQHDWTLIGVRAAESGIVDDPRAFNHLGYPAPAAWVDSRFANEGFALEAATEMFRWLRTPGLNVSLRTWLQPDIGPLDVITVESGRLGLSGIRLFVLSVTHEKGYEGPGSTTIVGRHFVPDAS